MLQYSTLLFLVKVDSLGGIPQISDYKSRSNLLRKMELSNIDPVPAWLILCSFLQSVILPAIWAGTVLNMEHCVGLCFQVEGNKFHHSVTKLSSHIIRYVLAKFCFYR